MTKKNKDSIEEIKEEIVIERLRQMPPTVKISLGQLDGKFLNKEDMIKEIQKGTDIGKKIVNIQFRYIKAFKEGLFKNQE